MKRTSSQRGQVGLVVLLTMIVLLTIGVSVATRSVTELRLARQEEETSKAFDAAETGVEEAISGLDAFIVSPDTVRTGSGEVGAINLNYSMSKINRVETRLEMGQAVDVNVTGAAAGAQIYVDWAKGQVCPEAASVEIVVINRTGGVVNARRTGNALCVRADNFSASTGARDVYPAGVTVTMQAGDEIVRVKPLYAASYVRVTGVGGWLPTQGYEIKSVANNTVSQETRAIEINRTTSAAPSVLDYVLFSGSTIIK